MIALFTNVKAILADIEVEAAKGITDLKSEAKVVETALAPVMAGFIQQSEAIAKQIGSIAFKALITQVGVFAKQVDADSTLTSGTAKFAAFMTLLEAWAKTEAPAVMALAGPAFRALLEMTIGAAIGAGTAAMTGGASVPLAAAVGAATVVAKEVSATAAAPATSPQPAPSPATAPNAAAAPAAPATK